MELIQQDGNRLIRCYDRETLIIQPWGKDSLRVTATKLHDLSVPDWALLLPKDTAVANIEIHGRSATVTNGNVRVEVSKTGKLTFYNGKGERLLEEYERNRKTYTMEAGAEPEGFASALDLDAREFRPIAGGDYSLTARFEPNAGEKIFGMGQYQHPYLNLMGCQLELAHRNSQASVPFLLSNKGYGFLWNNPAVGRVSFNKNLTTWHAQSTKVLDYWITAGDTPAEIEEHYATATGTVPMMPEAAMGFWQCKLRYQTQEELLNVAREYKKRGVPLSIIVVDFFHWTMQGEWKFDERYWPDPEGMIRELKEMGVEVMVSVWPTVDHRSENYREMAEKGYLISADRGVQVSMNFHGATIHYDATNPGAQKYVWNKAKQNYYEKGVRFFWLDEAEPEYNFYDYDNYRYYLGPDLQIGNVYPMLYAKGFYDGMQEAGQENILHLIRCAWAGSQRYGALVWSGDIDSSFESLRNQFAAGLNMGIAGIPWWTTDIGGFHGGWVDDPAFHELYIRWFEYAAFCPVMRLHGDREPHKNPMGIDGGGCCPSGADNEIWSYGDKAYEISKKYIFLREEMKPYITELMQAAHEKGTPVMRPLFYDFPGDKTCWEIDNQYMFGPDYLVAPILHAGAFRRSVYLPEGGKWCDFWSKQEYAGGQTIEVDAPIDIIPVFQRI